MKDKIPITFYEGNAIPKKEYKFKEGSRDGHRTMPDVRCPDCSNRNMVYQTTWWLYYCKKCGKTWNSHYKKDCVILTESKSTMSIDIPTNLRFKR